MTFRHLFLGIPCLAFLELPFVILSVRGSSQCIDKPLCTADDYYEFNSPCDSQNMVSLAVLPKDT